MDTAMNGPLNLTHEADNFARPMNIAIYLHQLYPGGIERVMSNLCHGFRSQNCRVVLITNQIGFEPALEWFGNDLGLHEIRPRTFWHRITGLRAALNTLRPDLLLSAQHFSNEIACLAGHMCRVPVVVSEHTTLTRELSICPRYSVRHWIPPIDRFVYRLANATVAVSDGVAEDFANATGLPRDKIQTIYNPVLPLGWSADMKADNLHPWLSDKTMPTLVSMGRLHEQKDYGTLLRALTTEQCKRVRLVIFGIGEERDPLGALAVDLGIAERVCFAGFTDSPLVQMQAADLYVLSSRWEGLPTVLVEALAVGTPVVATDCPSGPQEILASGRYGRLVPMEDPLALGKAIAEILRQGAGAVPSEWINQFRTEYVTEKYLRLFAAIISRSQSI